MNTGNTVTAYKILDAKGLTCPLPVLRARKAMGDVPPGGVLRVEATDPGAVKDFDALCKAGGHRLLAQTEDKGVLTFLIKKAG